MLAMCFNCMCTIANLYTKLSGVCMYVHVHMYEIILSGVLTRTHMYMYVHVINELLKALCWMCVPQAGLL